MRGSIPPQDACSDHSGVPFPWEHEAVSQSTVRLIDSELDQTPEGFAWSTGDASPLRTLSFSVDE